MDTGFGDLFYQANFEFSQQLLMSLFFLFYLQFLQLRYRWTVLGKAGELFFG